MISAAPGEHMPDALAGVVKDYLDQFTFCAENDVGMIELLKSASTTTQAKLLDCAVEQGKMRHPNELLVRVKTEIGRKPDLPQLK